jgi:hypothetical protein
MNTRFHSCPEFSWTPVSVRPQIILNLSL